MPDDLFGEIHQFLRSAPSADKEPILTDEESEALIMAFLVGRPEGVREDELDYLVAWAHGVIMEFNLLKLIFKGMLYITTPDGELLKEDMSNMMSGLTEKGKLAYNQLTDK